MSSEQTAMVVVAAVIVQDGQVLLRQRRESHIPENVGKWELPGGSVHFGEPFDLALRREIREELNLEIHVGRLLHSQINTYTNGVDYLVLYYACTLIGIVQHAFGVGVMLVEPSKVIDRTAIFGTLPGTVEAVSKLDEAVAMRSPFSFAQHAAGFQSPEQTLLILTYELGKVIEYRHKANCYGEEGYYSDANQRKEMSDLISMARYYCEQRGWDFEELMALGEEAYLERMEDLEEHGKVREFCQECGRGPPMHEPDCSHNEKMY